MLQFCVYRVRAYIANGWADAIIDPDTTSNDQRSTDTQPDNECRELDNEIQCQRYP